MRRSLAAFILACVTTSPLIQAADPDIVEMLKDAQATNRNTWKRGRANIRVEYTVEGRAGVGVLEGEVRWSDANLALKYKISDPDAVQFPKYGVDSDWNFVVRGPDRVLTYKANGNILHDWAPGPGVFDPVYNLSPLPAFSSCCAPSADLDNPWSESIGPSSEVAVGIRASSFSHRTLADGDIEQSRVDQDGAKNTIVFSARDGFAVRSMRHLDAAGKLFTEIEYTYRKLPDGKIAPGECKAELRLGGRPPYRVRYQYTDVRIPGDVTPREFSGPALQARVNRESDYREKRKAQAASLNKKADEASLDALSRSLRKSNTPPSP